MLQLIRHGNSIIYRHRANILQLWYCNKNIKIKNQRADTNSIHIEITKIPDFHDVSKDFLNIRTENLLKIVEPEISPMEKFPRLL